MPQVEISSQLYDELTALAQVYQTGSEADTLHLCLSALRARYIPAVTALVVRDQAEILMVGNDYGTVNLFGQPELVWNFPGGAVEPGEDIIQAVARELQEETGLTALEIGPLAWINQVNLDGNRPFVLAHAFEITAWEGEVSTAHEIDGGDVQEASFLTFEEAAHRMIPGNRTAFWDWVAGTYPKPGFYLSNPQAGKRVK